MKKRLILTITLCVLILSGCKESAYKKNDFKIVKGSEENIPQDPVISGEQLYNYIVSNASAGLGSNVVFPPYSETSFPDYVKLQRCNKKIKQGVYADYCYIEPTIVNFYYPNYSGTGMSSSYILPMVYFQSDSKGNYIPIYISY